MPLPCLVGVYGFKFKACMLLGVILPHVLYGHNCHVTKDKSNKDVKEKFEACNSHLTCKSRAILSKGKGCLKFT